MPAPKRELFKAAEVCEMAQLQPYVLRSWEAEFPRLGRPVENGALRTYRRGDVELVLRIKQLVFGEGLTLAGARRRLEEEDGDAEPAPSVAALAVHDALDELARTRLREIRSGLEAILAIVGHDTRVPELQLVPPDGGAPSRGRTSSSAGARAKSTSKLGPKSGSKRRRASA